MISQQHVVRRHGARDVAPQQVHFGDRLLDEAALFAACERELVLAQRLGVVALLPEGEAQVEVRQRAPRPRPSRYPAIGPAPPAREPTWRAPTRRARDSSAPSTESD